MSKKLTTAEELVAWTVGAVPSFLMNVAVKKNKIPVFFDLINLPILIFILAITLVQIYWKLKKKEPSRTSIFLWVAAIGWSLGAWLSSRFVQS